MLPPTPTHSHLFAAHSHLFPVFFAHSHSFLTHSYPLPLMFSPVLLNLSPLPPMRNLSHPFPVHIQTVNIIYSQLIFFFSNYHNASSRRPEYQLDIYIFRRSVSIGEWCLNQKFILNRCHMSPTCIYHLRGLKLLIKHELLQSWCHRFLLLLKFEMNVSY